MTREAFARRLAAVEATILGDGHSGEGDVATLVGFVARAQRPELVWLLMTATLGAFPVPEEVQEARRRIELDRSDDVAAWLEARASTSPGSASRLIVVEGAVVADCGYSAVRNHHSGIQRVVRSTMAQWCSGRQVLPVAWDEEHLAFRELAADELARLTRWAGASLAPEESSSRSVESAPILVPWGCTLALLDYPAVASHGRLSAIAQYSGNVVTAIGYDCIPAVSGDLVPPALAEEFAQYLAVIKHCDRVAAISCSAAEEFAGFAEMVRSQGLPGPEVVECQLPVDRVGGRDEHDGPPATHPVVLCIGSFEPRKNQMAVLAAAEMLWASGLRFELRLIGPGGWKRRVRDEVQRLRRDGHQVSILSAISETELAANYREAVCTVFVSLHEGYGLPVAESLAHGVPVITTNYGSTAEIASGGGCLLVDPRSDGEIADALARLLSDDDLVRELTAQIGRRQDRGWAAYADELWGALLGFGADKGVKR